MGETINVELLMLSVDNYIFVSKKSLFVGVSFLFDKDREVIGEKNEISAFIWLQGL